MLVLDLFCGTKSLEPIIREKGWEYIGLDIEKKFNPEICIDFLEWDYKEFRVPNIIWASPDCGVFSIASRGTSFNRDRQPVSDKARFHLKIIKKMKECINYFLVKNPNLIYFIENPTARLSWFITEYPRYDVSYCKYGFDRMKPTTIWTNKKDFVPQNCRRNPACSHIKAPRGSQLGTTAVSKKERYKVPRLLILDLLKNL
tara:strand:- start:315 stop:917 length:603 start_codon:yes stop_codon:yes gene_type:complete